MMQHQEVRDTDKVKDIPSGRVPISDTRFVTRNIKLSAALCALGFNLKIDRQPIAITIDAITELRIIDFFHDNGSTHPRLSNITAELVDLWWRSPKGKYSIEGFDDAIEAMRRVLLEREELILVAKDPKTFLPNGAKVDTNSLHHASILCACQIPLVGYDRRTRSWIFGKGAELVSDLIKSGGKPKKPRPISNDLCIDWMLAALKYRDWLFQMVKDPNCIPMIEMQHGQKILQISSAMDERERRKWISYL